MAMLLYAKHLGMALLTSTEPLLSPLVNETFYSVKYLITMNKGTRNTNICSPGNFCCFEKNEN